MKTKATKTKVEIIESERGWGQKVDEVREFDTREEADKFCTKYNKQNFKNYAETGIVPDWYKYAQVAYGQ